MKTKKSKTANEGPRPVTEMSLGEIQGYMSMHEDNINASKKKIEEFNAELRRRYEGVLSEYLHKQDKQHGQHTFEADGFKLTGEIRSTVKWDSNSLQQVAQTMPWMEVQKVFKIEFSVPEKTFNSITDEALRSRLVEARTVKYSEPKISFSS